jgi:hypothetical protein
MSPDGNTVGERDHFFRYERRGKLLRVTLRGMTNHEIRELLVGLWARLDADDRDDHLRELNHYAPMLRNPGTYPERHLSPIAEAIRQGEEGEGAIDLARFGHG